LLHTSLDSQRLYDTGIIFHLAEVKRPVHDSLQAIGFTQAIHGQIFVSTYAAWQQLIHPTRI
jgi:SulP family sulfate permease